MCLTVCAERALHLCGEGQISRGSLQTAGMQRAAINLGCVSDALGSQPRHGALHNRGQCHQSLRDAAALHGAFAIVARLVGILGRSILGAPPALGVAARRSLNLLIPRCHHVAFRRAIADFRRKQPQRHGHEAEGEQDDYESIHHWSIPLRSAYCSRFFCGSGRSPIIQPRSRSPAWTPRDEYLVIDHAIALHAPGLCLIRTRAK